MWFSGPLLWGFILDFLCPFQNVALQTEFCFRSNIIILELISSWLTDLKNQLHTTIISLRLKFEIDFLISLCINSTKLLLRFFQKFNCLSNTDWSLCAVQVWPQTLWEEDLIAQMQFTCTSSLLLVTVRYIDNKHVPERQYPVRLQDRPGGVSVDILTWVEWRPLVKPRHYQRSQPLISKAFEVDG